MNRVFQRYFFVNIFFSVLVIVVLNLTGIILIERIVAPAIVAALFSLTMPYAVLNCFSGQKRKNILLYLFCIFSIAVITMLFNICRYNSLLTMIIYFSATTVTMAQLEISARKFQIEESAKVLPNKPIQIMLVLICVVFLVSGILHLGKFVSVDEPKWFLYRVPQLFDALAHNNFSQTYINDKPGIIPALLSGIVNYFTKYQNFNPSDVEHYFFYWRLPILIFNFLLLPLIFVLIKKLTNQKTAIIATTLMALNPVLVGISQIVNPDATLWSLSIVAFLYFMLYLKTNREQNVYLSGFFLGLALLSKYFVSIFYIVFFVAIYAEYLSGKTSKDEFLQRCLSYLKVVVISMVIYAIFFPATWVNPQLIIQGTIASSILGVGSDLYITFFLLVLMDFFLLSGKFSNLMANLNIYKALRVLNWLFVLTVAFVILNSLLNFRYFDANYQIFYVSQMHKVDLLGNFLASCYMMTYTLTPLLLLPLTANGFIKLKDDFLNLILFIIYLTVILFLVGSSIAGFLLLPRYQIILYPLFSLASAIILSHLITKKTFFYIIGTALLSLISLLRAYPYYLNYSNFLNFKNVVVSESWGFGGYEVAEYLNSLDQAKDITIWSDREGTNDFFIGKSLWRVTANPFDKTNKVDYLVLTPVGERIFRNSLQNEKQNLYKQVASSTPLLDYYKKKPEFEILINGNPNNYIKVVKLH